MPGKYELRAALGRGAMGTVYEGWDPVLARRVAIKTVPLPDPADAATAEMLARFRREAQAAGSLAHPNIVAVHDYGETDTIAYIVMEYIDGPTLKSLLDQGRRFTLPDLHRIMDDVLAGLAYCHARGVVHRDIKPANVMLTADGQAKVADFGVARIESSTMTQTGTVIGTPAYMAPEQFIGQPVDARADIHAAGVLLYHLLTGERPYEGSVTSIMHKVLNVTPPAPSRLTASNPEGLDAVVLRAMAKRPEDRFATAHAFAAAIGAAIAAPAAGEAARGEDTTMFPPPAAAQTAGGGRTHRVGRGGAIVLLVLLALATAWRVLPGLNGTPARALAAIGLTEAKSAGSASHGADPAGVVAPTAAGRALRRRLAAAINATSCVLAVPMIRADTDVTVLGLAGGQAAEALLARLRRRVPWPPLSWRVRTIDPAFCLAIAVVRPVSPLAGAPALGLQATDGGGVTMPQFAGYLRVDLLHADGSVLHLYPPPDGSPARLAAGTRLRLPAGGHPTGGGAALLLAVASARPLELRFVPPPAEATSARYLLDLETAIGRARGGGGPITATAVPLGPQPAPE
ncbi:MAG: serine/threonine protein kinase [Proteobacteria bacterium]|nr:serine/threonine protein kinase [Pseudomonadota bacterium]